MPEEQKVPPPFEDEDAKRRFWEAHDSVEHVDWSRAERVRLPNLKPSPPA